MYQLTMTNGQDQDDYRHSDEDQDSSSASESDPSTTLAPEEVTATNTRRAPVGVLTCDEADDEDELTTLPVSLAWIEEYQALLRANLEVALHSSISSLSHKFYETKLEMVKNQSKANPSSGVQKLCEEELKRIAEVSRATLDCPSLKSVISLEWWHFADKEARLMASVSMQGEDGMGMNEGGEGGIGMGGGMRGDTGVGVGVGVGVGGGVEVGVGGGGLGGAKENTGEKEQVSGGASNAVGTPAY